MHVMSCHGESCHVIDDSHANEDFLGFSAYATSPFDSKAYFREVLKIVIDRPMKSGALLEIRHDLFREKSRFECE